SSNMFEGIDTTCNRIQGGKSIQPLVTQLLNQYDFKDPSKSINLLTKIYTETDKLPETIWKTRKQNEVKELIKDCAGLFLDLTTNEPYTTPDTKVDVKVEVANRSSQNIVLKDVTINNQKNIVDKSLANQEVFYDYFQTDFTNVDFTNFKFIDTFNDFKTQFNSTQKNTIGLEINGVYVSFPVQIQYHYKDVAKGEIYKPFHIIPKVSIRFKQPVYIVNSGKKQEISVILNNYFDQPINGSLIIFEHSKTENDKKNNQTKHLKPNDILFSNLNSFSLKENEKNKEIKISENFNEGTFSVYYQQEPSAVITDNGEIKWVDYNHIPVNYYL